MIFLAFAAATLGGAAVAVATRRLVRSVSGLALSFLGLAGLYYYLHSPFLALMQILIYVGAICVMIMFAMMLADLNERPRAPVREIVLSAGAALLAGVFGLGLIVLAGKASWKPAAGLGSATLQDVGRALLTRYGLAFELISVVLLLAILGALVVARSGRRTNP
jgi:NADH-quinone oxidoreductase subunit J